MKLSLARMLPAWVLLFIACMEWQTLPQVAYGSEPAAVPQLPGGIVVTEPGDSPWNRLILRARSRVATGDVDALSGTARALVSKFSITMMASIARNTNEAADGAAPPYVLKAVGIGYSMRIDGKYVTVSSADLQRLGVNLDFLSRRVLTEHEQRLADVRQIVLRPTLAIIDAPGIFLHEGQHRDFIVRHCIWVSPKTGRTATLVWRLQDEGGGKLKMVEPTMQLLPPEYVEDRAVHVDGDEIFLGIPTQRAFALVRLSAGHAVPISHDAAKWCALPSYDAAALEQFVSAVTAALSALPAQE